MKFEEVAQAYRDKKEIQFINNEGEWCNLRNHMMIDFNVLLSLDFRVKPEKVKRYQVVFYDTNRKIFDTTINKWESKKNFEDNLPESWVFDSLIMNSEEEFDQ